MEGAYTPDELVVRLGLWLREARVGVAAVAYREPGTAAAARRLLRPRDRKVRTFALPTGLTGRQTAFALIEAAEANVGGVLHVVGWEAAFGDPQMGERLYDLNFLRESVMEPSTAQVWWMPVAFRDAFMLLAVDTWSMVRLKPMLASDDEYVKVSPRIERMVKIALNRMEPGPIPARMIPIVHKLSAAFMDVSNSDLVSIARLYALRSLNLNHTSISDISPLSALRYLEGLAVAETSVSNISALASLTRLRVLYLTSTLVWDLDPLTGLEQLAHLDVGGTQVSDLSRTALPKSIDYLDVSNTRVSDLAPLASLTALKYLNISGTRVTDLSPLNNLTSLTFLEIAHSPISRARVAALKRSLPDCAVTD